MFISRLLCQFICACALSIPDRVCIAESEKKLCFRLIEERQKQRMYEGDCLV